MANAATPHFVRYIMGQLIKNEHQDNINEVLRGWYKGKLTKVELLSFAMILYNVTVKMIVSDEYKDQERKINIVASRCSNLLFQFVMYIKTLHNIKLSPQEFQHILYVAHNILKIVLLTSPTQANISLIEAWKMVLTSYITICTDHKFKNLTFRFCVLYELFELLTIRCEISATSDQPHGKLTVAQLKKVLSQPWARSLKKMFAK